MPLTLGQAYPPTWSGYPPHMSIEDLDLWKTYKLQLQKDILRLYFDVGLGGQTEIPPGTKPEIATMWLRNTQKRIDVLAETETQWRIIELRFNAQSTAIGRLLLYGDMWKKEAPDNRKTTLHLVTNRFDEDVKALAESLGINYIVL